MITIIHGDDIIKSREYFFQIKNSSKNALSFDQTVTLEDLTQAVQSNSLFFNHQSLFIENLLTNKKSPENATKIILKFINDNHKNHSIILFENTEISKSTLNLIKNAEFKLFKLPQKLFDFLDNIYPNNSTVLNKFHDCLKTTAEELILFMIIRQFRIMLALKNPDSKDKIDEIAKLAPWQLQKFVKQTGYFTTEKLLQDYLKLIDIDINSKIGNLKINLVNTIDFFLLSL